jgi:hypothetical protein
MYWTVGQFYNSFQFKSLSKPSRFKNDIFGTTSYDNYNGLGLFIEFPSNKIIHKFTTFSTYLVEPLLNTKYQRINKRIKNS